MERKRAKTLSIDTYNEILMITLYRFVILH